MKNFKCPYCKKELKNNNEIIDFYFSENKIELIMESYCEKCDKWFQWKEEWFCKEKKDFKEI